jgi:hypothetical protein
LKETGHSASPPTIRRLLKARNYSLRGNRKNREAGADHPDRNVQFEYIERQKQAVKSTEGPILSVDTKKKELIGNFKNAGRTWTKASTEVNVHDFPSEAVGRAVPYGIYDLTRNVGSIFLGDSADTPEFAVEALVAWWEREGKRLYSPTAPWLILADGGGSNGCRPRNWKKQLQEKLCDRLGVTVTVCHYPTGCSKWNPIEHRLFGPISGNWAGEPLTSFEKMAALIEGTTTQTGLQVRAQRLEGKYEKGQKVSDEEMAALQLERHDICPNWNYTLRPRTLLSSSP